jgi:hypothetical protein
MLLFSILFLIGLAGLLHVSWWAAMAGGCILAIALIARHDDGVLAIPGIDAATWSAARIMSSGVTSTIATLAAFTSGRAIDWLWLVP